MVARPSPKGCRIPAQTLGKRIKGQHGTVSNMTGDTRRAITKKMRPDTRPKTVRTYHGATAIGGARFCFYKDLFPGVLYRDDPLRMFQCNQRRLNAGLQQRAMHIGTMAYRIWVAEPLRKGADQRHFSNRLRR